MQLTIKLFTINVSIATVYLHGNKNYHDCMFLSCHIHVSEWIHSLQLPECQRTTCSKQLPNWRLKDCNWTWTQNHLVHKQTLKHLAKWLSVRLQTKWFWVKVQLQLLKTIMQPFLHYLKINSPPNKVVQTKNLVHYVLLRHVFFNNNLKSKPLSKQLVFLHDIFFEKVFISDYIFLLLEC